MQSQDFGNRNTFTGLPLVDSLKENAVRLRGPEFVCLEPLGNASRRYLLHSRIDRVAADRRQHSLDTLQSFQLTIVTGLNSGEQDPVDLTRETNGRIIGGVFRRQI